MVSIIKQAFKSFKISLIFMGIASALLSSCATGTKPDTANAKESTEIAFFNLDPNATPAQNFDLSRWKITLSSGKEESVEVLNGGFTMENQFYTDPKDGGMVFKNYPKAAGTTENSTYSRVELREMLRGNNKSIDSKGINGNNWVLSTSSAENQQHAGAVDGLLKATLKVNRVTETSGSPDQVGRLIIGQIHGSDDEPIRLYYHKQPNHRKGAIYFAHEPRTGTEIFVNLTGNYVSENGNKAGKYTGMESPANGIALNELFSYTIEATGNLLKVNLYNEKGTLISSKSVDMKASGYANDWLYFKAGVYSGNKKVLSSADYEQVTFYKLEASH